jgi:Ca2+-binding EF-hand superfamily protein
MHRFVILCGVLSLSASISALADDAATTPTPTVSTAAVQVTFQSIDRNGDHRISKTEAGSYKNLIDRFAVFDADGDGFISESEFQAAASSQTFQ